MSFVNRPLHSNQTFFSRSIKRDFSDLNYDNKTIEVTVDLLYLSGAASHLGQLFNSQSNIYESIEKQPGLSLGRLGIACIYVFFVIFSSVLYADTGESEIQHLDQQITQETNKLIEQNSEAILEKPNQMIEPVGSDIASEEQIPLYSGSDTGTGKGPLIIGEVESSIEARENNSTGSFGSGDIGDVGIMQTGIIDVETGFVGDSPTGQIQGLDLGLVNQIINTGEVNNTGTVSDTGDYVYDSGAKVSYTAGSGCDVVGDTGVQLKGCASDVLEGSNQTYCSLITKLNLKRITGLKERQGLGDSIHIGLGHAIDLISAGLKSDRFTELRTCEEINTILDRERSGTYLDVYLYNPDLTAGFGTKEFYLQGHRFTAFRGDDGLNYVLDPYRGQGGGNPQLLSNYQNFCGSARILVLNNKYYVKGLKPVRNITFVKNRYSLLDLFTKGKIFSYKSNELFQYADVYQIGADIGFIVESGSTIEIFSGTQIQTPENKPIDLFKLDTQVQTGGVEETGIDIAIGADTVFEFGIPQAHLIFSQPVKFTIETSLLEGDQVNIYAQHYGYAQPSADSISMTPDAQCSGGISLDNDNRAIVGSGGVVTFYSCGASTFFVATGTPASMPPGCNTFTDPGGINPGTGGLYGQFFAGYHGDNLNFFNTNAVGLTRIDPRIQFTTNDSTTWGNIIPPAGGSTADYNNYSARWRGSIYVPTAGTYTFRVSNADDGTYLRLDTPALNPTLSNVFINGGGLHAPTTYTRTVYLNTGYINMLMYYGENGGQNNVGLERQGPGITRQYIPTSNFCSAVINSKPGGINGCNLWLKANKGFTTSTTSPFAVWRDDSGFGSDSQNTVSVANSPVQIANAFNFNPAIRFQGTAATPKYLRGIKTAVTSNNLSSFIVQRTRNTAGEFGKLLYLYDSTDPAANSLNGANRLEAFMTYAGLGVNRLATIRANTLQGYADGYLNQTTVLSTHFTNTNQNRFFSNGLNTNNSTYTTQNFTYNSYMLGYGVGGYPAGDFADSDIAEVITCDFDVSSSGNLRNKIESYLSLKYGITLDQTGVGQNYVFTTFTGRTVSNGGIYNKNIAGIAFDSDTDLYQPKSQTISNTGDIIVQAINPLPNKTSLIWGNDAGSVTGLTYTESPSAYQRISREWKFQELNGDVGNVLITAPILPLFSGRNVIMMVDSDGNFANGGTTFVSGVLSGGLVYFTGNISNGQFVTFGVNSLSMWLRADSGVVLTGGFVSNWNDNTANNVVASQVIAANRPSLVTNTINFNPAVAFTGASTMLLISGVNTPLVPNSTVFAVGSPMLSAGYRTMIRSYTAGQDHPIIINAGTDNLGLRDNNGGTAFKPTGLTWSANEIALLQVQYTNTTAQFIKNSLPGTSINSLLLSTNRYDVLGNFQSNNQQFGNISEMIVYNTGLSVIDRNITESYLAVKYGITLNQSVDGDSDTIAGTSYRSSSGAVIWDSSLNAGYNQNIFGLGRDSVTSLDQRISRSVTTGDNLILSTIADFVSSNQAPSRTSLSDGAYVLVGNNAGTQIFGSSFNGGTNNRLNRIWRAQTQGTAGSVVVGLSQTGISLPGSATGVSIVISSDTVFTTGDTIIPAILSGGFYYASTTLPQGSYLTFITTNQPPVPFNDSGVVIEDGSGVVYVLANDTDANNDMLSITGLTNPSSGTVSILGTGVIYTPSANFCGTDSFTYRAFDGQTASTGIATVTISVTCVNDAPIAVNDIRTTNEDTTGSFNIKANDTDIDSPSGGSLITNAFTQPANGTVVNAGIVMTYVPNPNFCGVDSFTYTVRDSSGAVSNTGTVSITVTCINDAPVANNDSYNGVEDSGIISGNVLTNDTDVDSTGLTISIVVAPTVSGFTFSSTGGFTFIPPVNWCGVTSFGYQANDSSGGVSNTGTATITVACVNDAPVGVNDTYSTAFNTSLTIANTGVLGNDTDVDSAVLQVTLLSGTQNGSLSLNQSGGFTYTPNQYFIGNDTFTYRANDLSGGQSAPTTVTITVNRGSTICISSPDLFGTGIQVQRFSQFIDYQFPLFTVDDQKGSNSGYYTTLTVSNLSGANGTLSNSNISIKADPIQFITGYNNTGVQINATLNTYQIASSSYNFIFRNTGTNNNLAGQYGSKVSMRITIPAYQSVGTYSGVITYTLYEN